MNILEYSIVPVDSLESTHYQFSYPPSPPKGLVTSIRNVGILSPLLTIRSVGQLQILDGHRRLSAARQLDIDKVPISILPPLSPSETLSTWIQAQVASRSLNPFEIARVVEKGPEVFKINSDEIFNLMMAKSLISLPKKLLPDLKNISSLPERLKQEAVSRSYSPSFLVKISKLYPPALIKTISGILNVFSLSENQLGQMTEWMEEIAKRDKLPYADILAQEPLPFLLSHPKMPEAKKRDAILKAIYEKRFPKKTRLIKEFKEIQQKFSSIGNLNLVYPGEFVGESFELRITFKKPEELENSIQKITYLQDEIENLFKLL